MRNKQMRQILKHVEKKNMKKTIAKYANDIKT